LEQAQLKQVEAFTKVRQYREMVENLRNRKLEIYRQYVLLREQQELEDLFLMRRDLVRISLENSVAMFALEARV